MFALGSFLWVWIGQVISLFGSSLSGFALGIWLYQTTGSASNFALTALCGVLPQMLVSPLAGGLVDRYSRRRMMILGDSGAAACTLALAALFFSGQIQPWHIFLGTALSSACGALQGPAYAALVATAVPAAQLARANGMIQLGQGLAEVLAPAAAGALLAVIGVPGVLLLDLATFVVAVTSVALVQLPSPPPSPYPSPLRAHKACPSSEGGRGNHSRDDFGGKPQKSSLETGETAKSSLLAALKNNLAAGWDAVRARPGLEALLRFQMIFSFLWSLFGVLVSPMILGFADPAGLGLVLTAAGGGMLAGSLVLSAWGGPRRRLRGMLLFELASAAGFVGMGARPSLALVAGAAFLAHFTLAFVSGLNQSIWQSQVRADLLGRVLGLRQAAVKAATLLAYLLAGGLADRVLEPLLAGSTAPLAASLGAWVGTGPGRGIAALCILIGLFKAGAVLGVWLSPARQEL